MPVPTDPGGEPSPGPSGLHQVRSTGGLAVTVLEHGATIVSVEVPDRRGDLADVALGFDTVEGYRSSNAYFGATIGRVANRTAHGAFTLAGRRYDLSRNEGPHHLHGGSAGSFDAVRWDVDSVREDELTLRHVSPAGTGGYPGRVEVWATYRVEHLDLLVTYRAVSDEATPVNLTSHAYWNLAGAGQGTVLDHELQVLSDTYTVTDGDLIPTGAIEAVAGTALDFRVPRRIGERIGDLLETPALGYDHNYVLRDGGGTVRPAARLHDPTSGRTLELLTDQPALQVYSGNRLEPPVVGKAGRRYERFGGMCLEPQTHPDALHHAHFPDVVLPPGETYRHRTILRFSAA